MSKPRLSRRAFLRRGLASAYEIMFLGAGGSAYGFKVEPGWVDVSSVSLTLPGLASEFDGYRLAQISIPWRGPPVLPRHAKKYPVGLYQVGDMLKYTNRGVGTVPPRVRFNCHPEVTVFTLKTRA